MAEGILSNVVGNILEVLGSQLLQEVQLAFGVQAETRELKGTFETINGVLLDAEKQFHKNEGVKAWLLRLQDVAYDAEDLLDDFYTQLKLKRIANETYVESTNSRLEEWRIRRRDTEEWMRHRQLPEELRERVRRFLQYKWLATRGVDEESILQSLPLDLRRQIQRHLCLAYVRRVPLFAQMDQQLLDAICERLYSSLNTKDTYLIREDDPVNEMLFIIRGQVESSTTNGGRTGFFNSITLKTGDFCGEELLTWALMTTSTLNLPLSTRTVKSITEVEAFALRAEDLKFVASQFKRLHSKKLQHAFRYYSHQWRAWGACLIQAAWRRFIRKKAAMLLAIEEGLYATEEENYPINETSGERKEDISAERSAVENANAAQNPGSSVLSSKLNASNRRALSLRLARFDSEDSSLKMPKLLKPQDPDFCKDHQ